MSPSQARRLGSLGEAATRIWQGPGGLPRAMQLEWRFVLIRWIGLLVFAPVVPLLGLSLRWQLVVWAILLVAALYNLGIQTAIRRGLAHGLLGVLTSVGDGLLNVMMLIAIGGGFESPFAIFPFVVMLSVAMRFGYVPSLTMTALFVLLNALLNYESGRSADPTFYFRAAFLFLGALLASYLFEQGQQDQAALRASNAELRRAYADLAAAHQELMNVDEMKSTFIANVSHELRTPLTSVLAYAELLLTYEDPPPETRREFLEIIHGESARLTRLINEVLDISRIEAGQIELRRDLVDVRTMIATTARSFRPIIERQGLRFDVEIAPDVAPIMGDADRLQQVVGNLLNNAMKFTPDGAIRVVAQNHADGVLIAVTDTGVGIPPEHAQRVFDKFHQVGDVMTAKPSGTGLGLAICRELVSAHGGRIWVESAPGAGSTFSVALPARPAPALRAREPSLVS